MVDTRVACVSSISWRFNSLETDEGMEEVSY